METTSGPLRPVGTGRASAGLAASLREEISSGRIPAGEFLPTERRLSEKHGLARKTIRRALKTLEGEGLVATVPRRGYRVLARANDPGRGAPLTYVLTTPRKLENLTLRYRTQIEEMQKAASRRGWSLLLVTGENRTSAQMVEQVRVARASAMILDTEDPGFLELAIESGVPAVLVDAWRPEFQLDSVMQDGQQGGMLAAEHLAGLGHRRFAYVGSETMDAHGLDRLGGAITGLARLGLELTPEMRLLCGKDEAEDRLRELLAGDDRPTAFICLWAEIGLRVARAAERAGLRRGRDYDLVGWCVEELYDEQWSAHFPEGEAPPVVCWSMRTMAETAIARLEERRANPSLPALRVKVPTTLRVGGSEK
jgi:DNA-binding LacI/PurR family transcriptional regulator